MKPKVATAEVGTKRPAFSLLPDSSSRVASTSVPTLPDPSDLSGPTALEGNTASSKKRVVAWAMWELVRHHIVTDYAFKVGEHPGVVLFLHADSEDEARKVVDSTPIVEQGLLEFEVEPLRLVIHA